MYKMHENDDTHSSQFGSNEEDNAIINVSKKSLKLRSELKKYHLDSLYMKKKRPCLGNLHFEVFV